MIRAGCLCGVFALVAGSADHREVGGVGACSAFGEGHHVVDLGAWLAALVAAVVVAAADAGPEVAALL